jgi:outer membrane protein TolC
LIAAIFILLAGCHPQEPFFIHGDKNADLSHYVGISTQIEYPIEQHDPLADVTGAIEPFSVSRNPPKDFWDVHLEEVVEITLKNNKIIRTLGGQVTAQTPVDNILRSPDAISSIYDPALVESNPRTGVEAALSAFDTQWSTNMFWQKVNTPQASFSTGRDFVLAGDNATFVTQLEKYNATGGKSKISHNVQYALSNQINQAYPADWNVNFELEARQPLLRGAGVQVNRINGPGAQPGQYNGVMLARINMDIALADFEAAVRNLVLNVEQAYWELYFNYRNKDVADRFLTAAVKAYQIQKATPAPAADISQAAEQVRRAQVACSQALDSLYEMEAKLRYLMGIAPTDGRMIRPLDEPTTAKVSFDWYEIMSEGLVRNVELRRIKFAIKNRELQLIGAKNFLLPTLDVDALYRFRGMGNELLSSERNNRRFYETGSNAYQSLTSGEFQEWQVGLIMQVPIGFRRELSGVRNAQLSLSKERAILREAELELTHLLATAMRTMESDYDLINKNFQHWTTAQENVNAQEALRETRNFRIDLLLQAQRFLFDAETNYYRSLVNYNIDIMTIHYRKGSLLEYNGVYLAEGPWPGKAYFDARRRARARDAALYMDYGFTQPRVISEGEYQQHVGSITPTDEAESVLPNAEMTPPERLPTPTPESNDPGYNEGSDAIPAAPQPLPDMTTSASPVKENVEKIQRRTAAAKPAARKTRDISTLQLEKLEDKPIRQTSAIEPVKSSKPAKTREPVLKVPQTTSQLQWSAPKQKSNDESAANPPSVESEGTASGWQGVQR